jgi:hypothetical protein
VCGIQEKGEVFYGKEEGFAFFIQARRHPEDILQDGLFGHGESWLRDLVVADSSAAD